ncbi:hypothetical protein AB0I77_42545 [Streptomyces sp. NPDC050619]|uniref:hypothetical protein n=1 Tax=Streptomyces sp. NPDC050619 TaxID=3157214 RepID=UPI00341AC8CD
MAVTVPTADDVQALYAFILERADEEHAATMDGDAIARFCRISNSNKLAVTGTTAYVLDLLKQGDIEQAALAWDHLTAAGEEWREHPDYLARWETPKRAEIRRQLTG